MNALHVLAVDDTPQNLAVLQRFLAGAGHRVTTAATGQQGIDAFTAQRPDLVLMDVMLPDISGIEATGRIREIAGDHWVPVIFISALDQDEDVLRGLEAGGDDYLPKPIDLSLLEAKIKVMQRIAEMQKKLVTAAEQLEQYRDEAEQEQETARSLMSMMVKAATTDDPGLKLWLQPTTRFSGDLLIASRSRFGHLYVLHADSMGHGLTAALPLLPIAQIFRTMCERGITLPVIVDEMNSSLKKQIPRGSYVAATVACIDRHNRTVEVWNGGNPTALLVDAAGKVLHNFKSRHLALGILDTGDFDASTAAHQVTEGDAKLLLYSDGLSEARNGAGEPFGDQRILDTLRQGGDMHAALAAAVRQHLAGANCHDDISLVAACCT